MSKHDELRARELVTSCYDTGRLANDAIAAVGELEAENAKLRKGVVHHSCDIGELYVMCGCCFEFDEPGVPMVHTGDCPMKETK